MSWNVKDEKIAGRSGGKLRTKSPAFRLQAHDNVVSGHWYFQSALLLNLG